METDPKAQSHEASQRGGWRLPIRLSVLFVVVLLTLGSTTLGFYYYYVYSPPLTAAEMFLDAMETGDQQTLAENILIRTGPETDDLRLPTEDEIEALVGRDFQKGRILDQRKREGGNRTYHYLIYREPDGQVYALVVTQFEGQYHVVIPNPPMSEVQPYLWDYIWTN